MTPVLGWTVLALVFLDELLALVGLGVFGWSTSTPRLLVWLLPLVGMLTWATFASPEARFGGGVGRPVAKVAVFGAATAGLWVAGHHGWAGALLVFSLVVNGLAMLPSVRDLIPRQPSLPADPGSVAQAD